MGTGDYLFDLSFGRFNENSGCVRGRGRGYANLFDIAEDGTGGELLGPRGV